jgi:hypothetical protein
MTQSGTWVSYGGPAAIALAGALAAGAAAVVYAGIRLPLPARLPRPGKVAGFLLLAIWPLAIAAFPVCAGLYAVHAGREHLTVAAPADPVTPVTLIGVGVIFFVIVVASSASGWHVAMPSAVIGALAAPMIFEFPFDLIVMTRTYPPIPPDPALYRVLFFAPLFLIEAITLALLTLSPAARLSQATLWWLAAMLAVFAVWALFGFAYPSAPIPTALNMVSKVLALITALSLFVPPRTEPGLEAVAPATPATASAPVWTNVM